MRYDVEIVHRAKERGSSQVTCHDKDKLGQKDPMNQASEPGQSVNDYAQLTHTSVSIHSNTLCL